MTQFFLAYYFSFNVKRILRCIIFIFLLLFPSIIQTTVASEIISTKQQQKPHKPTTTIIKKTKEYVTSVDPTLTQWASRIVYVSSSFNEHGPFSAEQLLGKPNLYSYRGTQNPCAWAAKYEDKENQKEFANRVEIIRVGFQQPMYAGQIAIVEALNPGAVGMVVVYGEEAEMDTVYQVIPSPAGTEGRVLNIFFEPPNFRITDVEIHLHTGAVPDWNLIDAIALSNAPDSVHAEINVTQFASEIKVEKMGTEINSGTNELAPVISPDGKTLYFSRSNHAENISSSEATDIWYSELMPDGKSFSKAKNIGAPLNDIYPNFVCSITPDGTRMLLGNEYVRNAAPRGGTSISLRTDDGGWSIPKALNIVGYYSRNNYGHFCLSSDRKTLLSCLNRDEGAGNQDIYVSFQESDSTWTRPRNIGRTINTAGDESTVFLAPDTRTMFFSSSGHNGYGDKDIFVSTRLDSTWLNWSEPKNMGPKVNSAGGDAYYSVDVSGVNAYYVSTRGRFDNSDIYHIILPPSLQVAPAVLVEGHVYNVKTQHPVRATILYEDLKTGREVGMAQTNPKTGEYKIVLPAGNLYGFRAEADSAIPVSEHLDLRELKQFQIIRFDLSLVPLEVGQKVLLNNLFFDFNKSIIQPESYSELRRMADVLRRNQSVRIMINGHTDDIGNDEYNLQLSKERAQAVLDFFVNQGVQSNQIEIQGLGKTQPIAPNNTEQDRQKNRRVEFIILAI
ncbi:MAG: OmpA family protein [Bacteroidetes bacterium]|nr:OmpA family protein [Bacteroidota bacterium]